MRRVHVIAAMVLACTALEVAAVVDDIYRAGDFMDHTFYWVPVDAISPDTVAWGCLQGPLPVEQRDPTIKDMAGSAAYLASKEYTLYRLKKCSAISMTMLVQSGHHVCVLSQWHASLKHKVKVPKPGMSQKEMRHNLVSDFTWESLERSVIEPATGTMIDFRVRLYFTRAGYSDYDAKDLPTRDNRQILGTHGFAVEVPEVDFQEDLNVRRKIFGVYLCAPSSKKARDIVREVEVGMDKRKLDLSYTVPTLTPVGGGGDGTK